MQPNYIIFISYNYNWWFYITLSAVCNCSSSTVFDGNPLSWDFKSNKYTKLRNEHLLSKYYLNSTFIPAKIHYLKIIATICVVFLNWYAVKLHLISNQSVSNN